MSELPSGLTLALILAAISLLAHEPWRWVGMFLGRNLDMDSELFLWVRAVSTALVAALVIRLVVFPAGALGGVPLAARAVAIVTGVAVYLVAGRRMWLGVSMAALALVAGRLAIG
ncbi:MAG: AzlD domain-containing protein [Hyphomicrobiaceae bacterium]